MGLQLQITHNSQTIYQTSIGLKDNKTIINNQTLFGVASISKSITASAIMLLVQQNKITLTQPLSQILGFNFHNPYFPTDTITLQMLLTHQSSLVQCQPFYSQFLQATYNFKSGYDIPSLQSILVRGGKYYNDCMFSSKFAPGTHFQYVNLNYGIVGALIQNVGMERFDLFVKEKILGYVSLREEVATFDVGAIGTYEHLGAAFYGKNGEWVPDYDYYPDGNIPQKNMTGYKIGHNGVVFSPQAGMRASVHHLSNYAILLANKGVTKQGIRVLSQKSVEQMLKPRYQYHGDLSRTINDYNLYGFGIYTTSYRKSDNIIAHEVVRGHLGADHGMISGLHFWNNYTLTYIINGALNGYQEISGQFYEGQRIKIHKAVDDFIKSTQI